MGKLRQRPPVWLSAGAGQLQGVCQIVAEESALSAKALSAEAEISD
jgi:hypothetical protein